MNRKLFRIVIGVIWLIGAVVSFFKADFIMAALFVIIGVVFLLAAGKGSKSGKE